MNKVILLGRLTKDVEMRYTQTSNVAVASFSLAVNRKFTKEGEEQQADFINIVAWKNLAENASKYLKKGSQVLITGRLQIRNYDDEQGQKHYITEVVAEEFDFVEPKRTADINTLTGNTTPSQISEDSNLVETVSGDDLPF